MYSLQQVCNKITKHVLSELLFILSSPSISALDQGVRTTPEGQQSSTFPAHLPNLPTPTIITSTAIFLSVGCMLLGSVKTPFFQGTLKIGSFLLRL